MKNYLTLLLLFFMVSCSETGEKEWLPREEFSFNEELISLASIKHGEFWIGTKNGAAILFQDGYGVKRYFDFKENRIYKVLPEYSFSNDTLLYVGMRNGGVQLWKAKGNLKLQRQYTIQAKGSNYSPYDFIKIHDTLYVATSNGLYKTITSGPDADSMQMELIFPSQRDLENRGDREFIIHNLQMSENGKYIYCSSPVGVIKYSVSNGIIDTFINDKKINHVSLRGDTITALTDEQCYTLTLDNHGAVDTKDSISGLNKQKVFLQDALGNSWLITNNRIKIKDRYSYDSVSIGLPTEVPLHGRQVIIQDSNYIFLLAKSALWKIPLHRGTGKWQRNINAACKDGKNIYFISLDGGLYCYSLKWLYFNSFERYSLNSFEGLTLFFLEESNFGLFEKEQAMLYSKINPSKPIKWIAAGEGNLYMHEESDSTIYKLKIPRWRGIFGWRSEKPAEFVKGDELITVADWVADKKNGEKKLFVGTRNSLSYVEVEKDHLIKRASDSSGVYITSICNDPLTGSVYYTTLNDGTFSLDSNISKTKKKNLQGIVCLPRQKQNILYTNQYIFYGTDSIRAKGISKMFAANDSTIIGLPDRGINIYKVTGNQIKFEKALYEDIAFAPAGSFMLNDSLVLLSSGIGAMILPINDMNDPEWVQFADYELKTDIIILIIAIVIVIAICIIIVLGIFRYFKKKKENELLQIKEQNEEELLKLKEKSEEELLELKEKNEEELLELKKQKEEELLKKISGYHQQIKEYYTIKKVFVNYKDVDEEIESLNRSINETITSEYEKSISSKLFDLQLHIHKCLPKMIGSEIEWLNKVNSKEAEEMKNSLIQFEQQGNIMELLLQFVKNREWLQTKTNLEVNIENDKNNLTGCVEIEGLTQGLYQNLCELKTSLSNIPLKEIEQRYKKNRQLIAQISNKDGQQKLTDFINKKINEYKNSGSYFEPVVAMIESLKNEPKPILEQLKTLKKIIDITELCNILKRIDENYNKHKKMLSENKNIKEAVDNNICAFYEKLPEHEKAIFSKILPIRDNIVKNHKILVLLFVDEKMPDKSICALLNDARTSLRDCKSKLLKPIKELSENDPILSEKYSLVSVLINDLKKSLERSNS